MQSYTIKRWVSSSLTLDCIKNTIYLIKKCVISGNAKLKWIANTVRV
jgi:hypothetical protein